MQDEKRTKGTFSKIRLAITKSYVYPFSRRRMLLLGFLGCIAVAAYFLLNSFFQHSSFVIGPLSSAHAAFEPECAQCHESFKAVNNSKCSICHEKSNDKLGVYTFSAHYWYRSSEKQQATKARAAHISEMPCAACHPEHSGREAAITRVRDAKCVTCHEYSSFNKGHPEFTRLAVPDDSTLIFTHVRHTSEVLKKIKSQNVERACLYCHRAESDGKHFKPLDFDVQCADCHLNAAVETPSLAIRDPGNPMTPGVETLQMIQNRRGPGTLWAFYTNPNEFTTRGAKIVKSPVYHKDPWILENLKTIRDMLYADPGLTALLKTAGKVTGQSTDGLYAAAIRTLQDYSTGLRSRPEPEIQSELSRIDSLLKVAQTRASNPTVPLSESLFVRQVENPALTAAQKADFEAFASKLAKPCQECHVVNHASIQAVKSIQQVLTRSEFDHRAHILQKRCLECHTAIPIEQAVFGGDTTGMALKDRSATQNIPGIQNCFECHNKQEASNRCVTCHFMHPNKIGRGSLELYVEKE